MEPCPDCALTTFSDEQIMKVADEIRFTVAETEAHGTTDFDIGIPTSVANGLLNYFDKDNGEYEIIPTAPKRNRIKLLHHDVTFLANPNGGEDPWFSIMTKHIVK